MISLMQIKDLSFIKQIEDNYSKFITESNHCLSMPYAIYYFFLSISFKIIVNNHNKEQFVLKTNLLFQGGWKAKSPIGTYGIWGRLLMKLYGLVNMKT